MALSPISYLDSWLHSPGPRGRQPDHLSDSDEDDNTAYQDLPEESISSSFPSVLSHPSHGNRHENPGSRPGSNGGVEDAVSRNTGIQVTEPEPEPGSIVPEEAEWLSETTGAFEVGRGRRIAQICIAVIYCFLSAGIIFGFAAIKPVLIKEGVYRHLCSDKENSQRVPVCYGQEIRVNLMFTVAAVAANVSAFPVGTILDTYGPRVCGTIGSCLLVVGAFSLAFAAQIPVFDAYIAGYFFLALGGPFVYISSFHLSNAVPTHLGLVLAAFNGAFDASSAVFLIFRVINEKTGGSFSIQRFALAYLVPPLFIITAQIFIMPSVSYKTAGELIQQAHAHIAAEASDRVRENIQDHDERVRQRSARRTHRQEIIDKIHGFLVESGDREAASSIKALFDRGNRPDIRTPTPSNHVKPNKPTSGSTWGTLHGLPAAQQIRSPWFILITLFAILQMLRLNYFIASIRQQYEYLFASPRLARHLNEDFDFILPIGGLIAVPLVGAIMDYWDSTFILTVLVTTATLIGILGCIPHSQIAGYANIALFVIYRPFYYTAISDYAAKVFGFQTFGKVYGLMICLAGLGNFAQAGLDILTFRVFCQNPIPVNVVLTAVTGLVGMLLVVFVWWRTRYMANLGTVPGIEDGGMSFHENEDDDSMGNGEEEPLLNTPCRPGYETAGG